MILVALCIATLLASCNARCYDKYTLQSYGSGQTYTRIKLMGENTKLQGTYSCTCYRGGIMRCSAVDIPCLDTVTKAWVPKEERFNVPLRGRPYNCLCKGGRGSFRNCLPGYIEEDGSCRDINGEKVPNGDEYLTRRFGAVVECRCEDGLAARDCKRVCVDSDTGLVVPLNERFAFVSYGVKYRCFCGEDGHPTACTNYVEEVDPCRSGTNDCDPSRATCTPRGSSYSCQCDPGYDGDGRTCDDVDECFGSHRCDENASCINTQGSYTCACNGGYSGDGYLCVRQNVDTCDENAVFCDVNARCEPAEDSFVCKCGIGYTGTGFVCDDLDECAGDHGCDTNAACNNTLGSYLCFCNYGYSGDGFRCQQMCRDELTGAYVHHHAVFTKVKNGRQMACTCGQNGEELEGSCFGGEEEEEEAEEEDEEEDRDAEDPEAPGGTEILVEAPCGDDLTGQMVESGGSFTKRYRSTEYTCRCLDGDAAPGSCTRKAPSPTCRKGDRIYALNESYSLTRRGRRYQCTCHAREREGAPPVPYSRCTSIRQ